MTKLELFVGALLWVLLSPCSPHHPPPLYSTPPWPPVWQAIQLTCLQSQQHQKRASHWLSGWEWCCQVRCRLTGSHGAVPAYHRFHSTPAILLLHWSQSWAADSSGTRLVVLLVQRCAVLWPAARVHPGETNSSWMMKGALQQLLADTEEAAQLREMFVFKVRCTAIPRTFASQAQVACQHSTGA